MMFGLVRIVDHQAQYLLADAIKVIHTALVAPLNGSCVMQLLSEVKQLRSQGRKSLADGDTGNTNTTQRRNA